MFSENFRPATSYNGTECELPVYGSPITYNSAIAVKPQISELVLVILFNFATRNILLKTVRVI